MANTHLKNLLDRYINDSLAPGELQELLQLLHSNENEEQVQSAIEEALTNVSFQGFADEGRADVIFNNIMQTVKAAPVHQIKQGKVFSFRRIAVAASVLIFGAVGSYFAFFNKAVDKPQIAKTDIQAPQSNRATITLSNGQQIFLDSAGNGTLATVGNVQVAKLADGQITYTGTSSTMECNTLTNPKGSKVINLTLADGTKVWLNAESSLKYPAAFLGNSREVEITGEAYFDVTHNAAKPFKVKANGTDINDIGTQFNVNAYTNEENMKVTLVQGAIEIQNKKLLPGQQAILTSNGQLTTNNLADLDEITAWKDGFFHFESADLKTILRQYARWYDIDVSYEGKISNDKYFSIVNRNSSLANVLKSLQANGIKFRIEDKKLFVQGK